MIHYGTIIMPSVLLSNSVYTFIRLKATISDMTNTTEMCYHIRVFFSSYSSVLIVITASLHI